jgi:competence protein ComFB
MSKYYPEKDFSIVNGYDELVRATVADAIAKEPGMCGCEKCFLDVCAIVFNNGFSNFVTTKVGSLYAKLEDMKTNNHVDLYLEVVKAIAMVKERPMHPAKVEQD